MLGAYLAFLYGLVCFMRLALQKVLHVYLVLKELFSVLTDLALSEIIEGFTGREPFYR